MTITLPFSISGARLSRSCFRGAVSDPRRRLREPLADRFTERLGCSGSLTLYILFYIHVRLSILPIRGSAIWEQVKSMSTGA